MCYGCGTRFSPTAAASCRWPPTYCLLYLPLPLPLTPTPTPNQEGAFDFLLYVGATMVICMRDEILEHNDFAFCVKKLQARQ